MQQSRFRDKFECGGAAATLKFILGFTNAQEKRDREIAINLLRREVAIDIIAPSTDLVAVFFRLIFLEVGGRSPPTSKKINQ